MLSFVGKGESTFKLLIDRVKNKEDYSDLDGIAFVRNGNVTINKPREFIQDLDTLPLLMWQDLPMNANILTKHPLTMWMRDGRRGRANTVSRSVWMRFYP